MQTLRGELVDWARIERDHLRKRACADCGATKFKPEFGKEWGRKEGGIVCEVCAKSMRDGNLRQAWCAQCEQRRPRPDWHAERDVKTFRIRSCAACETQKAQVKETKRKAWKAKLGEWNQVQISTARAASIACVGCGRSFEKGAFSGMRLEKRAQERLCRECAEKREHEANVENVVNAARADVAAKRELQCASCDVMFAWQKHITRDQRKNHVCKGKSVVCKECFDKGFTARSWEAFRCSGPCNERLPRSAFPERGRHVADIARQGKLTCTKCRHP